MRPIAESCAAAPSLLSRSNASPSGSDLVAAWEAMALRSATPLPASIAPLSHELAAVEAMVLQLPLQSLEVLCCWLPQVLEARRNLESGPGRPFSVASGHATEATMTPLPQQLRFASASPFSLASPMTGSSSVPPSAAHGFASSSPLAVRAPDMAAGGGHSAAQQAAMDAAAESALQQALQQAEAMLQQTSGGSCHALAGNTSVSAAAKAAVPPPPPPAADGLATPIDGGRCFASNLTGTTSTMASTSPLPRPISSPESKMEQQSLRLATSSAAASPPAALLHPSAAEMSSMAAAHKAAGAPSPSRMISEENEAVMREILRLQEHARHTERLLEEERAFSAAYGPRACCSHSGGAGGGAAGDMPERGVEAHVDLQETFRAAINRHVSYHEEVPSPAALEDLKSVRVRLQQRVQQLDRELAEVVSRNVPQPPPPPVPPAC
eukprot:TRINITY_DN8898_c0_g1_i1.p1 TRINITY_DN8898_c0_g1~~TRINITY_DN8898_c0_g1_i1.p1  ORF type:complete len:439 (+),score=134.36 TRINITY_DN8898_c0_g1_i1:31-1347(+)